MTYFVPEQNVNALRKIAAKLMAKAAKLGSDLSITVTQNYKDMPLVVPSRSGMHPEVKRYVRTYEVLVTGTQPSENGWKFIGTVEAVEDGNILRLVPGVSVPESFRTLAPGCDHCKAKRNRRDCYLVQNTVNGNIMQVGSSCLQDFIGNAAQKITRLTNLWLNVDDVCTSYESRDGSNGSYTGSDYRYSMREFLAYVAVAVSRFGFMSRKASDTIREKAEAEGRTAHVATTASRAVSALMNDTSCDTCFTPSQEEMKAGYELADNAQAWLMMTYGTPLDMDTESVDDLTAWSLDQNLPRPGLNDFEYNLFTVGKSATVTLKNAGIAAYVIEAYRKAHNLVERRSDKTAESKHIGTVGERMRRVTVTCDRVFTGDSAFGTYHIFTLSTPDGNCLTWKTSSPDLVVGESYVVDATVKKHDEFRGKKQTVLSRVKIIEEIVALQKAA